LLTLGFAMLSQHGPMILWSTTKRSKAVAVEPKTCEYCSPAASMGMSDSPRLPAAMIPVVSDGILTQGGEERRTREVASDLEPVRLLPRDALYAEGVSPLDVTLRARDVSQVPLALRIVEEVALDIVKRQLVVLVVRIVFVDLAAVVCGRKW
jgi:hypothetical protein